MVRTLAAAITLLALPAAAHHGWSEYDSTKPLTFTARFLRRIEHPHGHTARDARQDLALGAGATFAHGASRPAAVRNRTVTVVGYANREKPEEMRAERITAGGKTVELR